MHRAMMRIGFAGAWGSAPTYAIAKARSPAHNGETSIRSAFRTSGAAMPRIRFSLKTLFLVLLVAMLAGSHVFTSYRLKQTHDENVKLRTELGYLTIEDRTKVHVVRLATHEDLKWQWRVYVPEGAKVVLKTATHRIPEFGLPADWHVASECPPGEYTLTAAVRRDRAGQWQFSVAGGGINLRSNVPEAAAKWLADRASTKGWSAGAGATETKDAGKPLRLLRVLSQAHLPPGVSPTIGASDEHPSGKPNRIGDGLMIWIDDATREEIDTFFSQP